MVAVFFGRFFRKDFKKIDCGCENFGEEIPVCTYAISHFVSG